MWKCAVTALLAALATGAGAQSPKPAEVWLTAGHIALTATEAAGGLTAEWQFDRADNGDVRLVKNERRGDAKSSGTVLSVCGDQALLLKDIAPQRGRELRELNEPVLFLQLALRLLARAMPEGLPAAGREIAIDVGDEKTTLRLRKNYSARKDIGAPWRARGTARRTASGVRFEMVVSHGADFPAQHQTEIKLAGVWEQQSRMPALANGFDIAGWRVHRVDTVSENVGGNAVLDSAAVPKPLSFATLGDVRASIERWWDPNEKAAPRGECKV